MKAFGTVRLLGVAIAGALLAGTVALAQAPGGGMGPGPGFGEHRPPMERAFGQRATMAAGGTIPRPWSG